jgi:hypothetical protein
MAMEESSLEAKKFRSAKKKFAGRCGNLDLPNSNRDGGTAAPTPTPPAIRVPTRGVIDRLAGYEGWQAGAPLGGIGKGDRQVGLLLSL